MKGDFTRDTFRPARHYSSVRMQQGRVQLDADWNEAEDIRLDRERTVNVDVIGGCGTPEDLPGFGITFGGTGFQVGRGRYYVDGILAENEADVDFDAQPDYPGITDPATGAHLFYLDVWEEHVTALEDEDLREVALNGPDTATRLRVVWQVRTAALPTGVATCAAAMASLPGPTTARLQARAKTPDDNEACTVKPGSQYKRLENQLYRVEVHAPGTVTSATFKWSRDNGTVVTGFTLADGRTLVVDQPGRDQLLSFASGQTVEVIDRKRELLGQPGDLFTVARVEGNKLILDASGPAVVAANYGTGVKVRRWDSDGAVTFTGLDADGYLALEDGVQIRLTGNDFRTGDYWLIPARTVLGDVEWPQVGGLPEARPPHGIVHHRCPLAIATKGTASWSIIDCRNPFVPLTQVISMYYVAGDGQTATPDPLNLGALLTLPQVPTVGVSRGNQPVVGAQVRFTVALGGGQIVGLTTVPTNQFGLAACQWRLTSTDPVQQLRAELLDSEGAVTHLPIVFTATLNTADKVAYTPNCPDLQKAGANTVQKAIDELCRRHGSNGCCKSVGEGGDYETIEEALKELLSEEMKLTGICLCLMPGTHPWPAGDVDFPKHRISLTLTGIRGASLIDAEKPIEIGPLDTLVISDLMIRSEHGIAIERAERVDLSSTRIRAGKRLAFVDVQMLRVSDSRIEMDDGDVFVGDCDYVWIRDCAIGLEPREDGLTVRENRRFHLENSVVRGLLKKPESATVRVEGCKEVLITGNQLTARGAFADATTNVTGSTNENTGLIVNTANMTEFVRDLGRTMNRTALTRRARNLMGASTTDREARLKELDEVIAENALAMGDEGRKRMLALRETLSRADVDEAAVAAAVAEISRAVSDRAMNTGALALNEAPGVALILADGESQCTVSGNTILGFVSLYGSPSNQRLLESEAKLYDARIKQGASQWGIGTLHFSNNDVLNVLLAGPFTSRSGTAFQEFMQKGTVDCPVFRTATVSDNTFTRFHMEMLFSAVTFSGNVLNQNVEYAGIIIAHRATYTGNIAYGGMNLVSATMVDAAAANISLNFA